MYILHAQNIGRPTKSAEFVSLYLFIEVNVNPRQFSQIAEDPGQ